jgi:hypothetical protein
MAQSDAAQRAPQGEEYDNVAVDVTAEARACSGACAGRVRAAAHALGACVQRRMRCALAHRWHRRRCSHPPPPQTGEALSTRVYALNDASLATDEAWHYDAWRAAHLQAFAAMCVRWRATHSAE